MTFATRTITALRQCAAITLLAAMASSPVAAEQLTFAPKTRIELGVQGGKLRSAEPASKTEFTGTERFGRGVIATTAPAPGDKGTCLHYTNAASGAVVPVFRVNIIRRTCKAALDVKRLTPAWVIGTKTLPTMETIYNMGKG